MRIVPVLIVTFLIFGGVSHGERPKPEKADSKFFERLDINGDGRVSLKEAPEQGKMLVEFLLSQSGKKGSDHLDRAEFMRLTHRNTDERPHGQAVAAAFGAGDVQPAPDNCPACAMGLTAEFVFKRLDVDEDKFVTAIEFMRSPGMDDEKKAREVEGASPERRCSQTTESQKAEGSSRSRIDERVTSVFAALILNRCLVHRHCRLSPSSAWSAVKAAGAASSGPYPQ